MSETQRRRSERIKRLALAVAAGITMSGVLTGLVVAAWTIHGLFLGGFRNLNDIVAMITYATVVFVVCVAAFAAYFTLRLWRDWK